MKIVIASEYWDAVNSDDLFLYAHNVSIIGNAFNVRALWSRELSLSVDSSDHLGVLYGMNIRFQKTKDYFSS